MTGYEINNKDIEAIIRYLKIHDPKNADKEYAIQILELMKETAKQLVNTDMEFTELLLKTLKKKKQEENSNSKLS